MAKQDKTAIATTPAPLATASSDAELAAALSELGDVGDGLEEVDGSDVRLSVKVFNFKGLDAEGEPILPNVFYDTVTEQTTKTLDIAFLKLHKTNEWREYDEGLKKNVVHCKSFDQVKGEMNNGTIRGCDGCPDAKWITVEGKDGKPKRTRRCNETWNMFAYELNGSRQPCVIRFRRTALPAIVNYMNKHHIGKRVVGGKMGNWPAFVFHCRVSLRMSDDKKYALPVLEKVGNLGPDEIKFGAEGLRYVDEVLLGELRKVVDSDRSDEVDTSFDTSTMGNSKSDRFVDDEGASTPAFVE